MKLITKQYNTELITFDITSNVMINLTEMARANGREIKHWLALDSTKSYLMALQDSEVGKSHIEIRKGGNAQQQGTWGSRRVAIRLAQWLSDKFSIWVDTQIEELLSNGEDTIKDKRLLVSFSRHFMYEMRRADRAELKLKIVEEELARLRAKVKNILEDAINEEDLLRRQNEACFRLDEQDKKWVKKMNLMISSKS